MTRPQNTFMTDLVMAVVFTVALLALIGVASLFGHFLIWVGGVMT